MLTSSLENEAPSRSMGGPGLCELKINITQFYWLVMFSCFWEREDYARPYFLESKAFSNRVF